MKNYIYGLIDPTNHRICYIGRTIHLYDRFDAHADEFSESLKGQWMQRLRASGILPTIVILDSIEYGDIESIETWWIEFGRRMGWPLSNTIHANSNKYKLETLPRYDGEKGHWEDGVWVSDGEWWKTPTFDDVEDSPTGEWIEYVYNPDDEKIFLEDEKSQA